MQKVHLVSLKLDSEGLNSVVDHLTLGIIEVERLRGVLRDENDVEAAVLEHTWELTLTGSERNGLRSVIVTNVDSGKFALLVVIVRALVFVELELTILTCIDIEVDELGGLLIAPFHLWSEGDNGSLTHINRNLLIWCFDYQTLTTLHKLVGIEVIPATLFGEVDRAVAGLVVASL